MADYDEIDLIKDQGAPLDQGGKKRIPPATLNVAFLGILFFMLFFSYNTTQTFQTSLYDTLGFYSLSVLYFFFSLSNFFSSTVIRKIGIRLSLFLGGLGYTQFIAINIFVSWRLQSWSNNGPGSVFSWQTPYILVFSSGLLGIAAAVLWNAQGVYLSKSSNSNTVGFHSGLFFCLFQFNLVFGNLFAAVFLSFGWNVSYLFVILTAVSLVPSILFLFLRTKYPDNPDVDGEEKKPASILEVFYIFKIPAWLLIVPISIYSGLSQSLNYGSFTELIGEINQAQLGFVMAVYGVINVIGSALNGVLSKKIGRRGVIVLGSISAVIPYVVTSVLFYWKLDDDSEEYDKLWAFYVCGIFLGYADSVFNTQLYSILGAFFPNDAEPIFAGLKMIQATSTAAAFFYTPYISYPVVVLIVVIFLSTGLVSLVVLDRFVKGIDSLEDHRAKRKHPIGLN